MLREESAQDWLGAETLGPANISPPWGRSPAAAFTCHTNLSVFWKCLMFSVQPGLWKVFKLLQFNKKLLSICFVQGTVQSDTEAVMIKKT